MTGAEVPPSGSEKKTWVPLENNPEVMSKLVHKMGLASSLEFYDVCSIDDVELLSFIPRPAYALLFISPAAIYWNYRKDEDQNTLPYSGSGDDEPIIWYKQTIGNACGMIGCLHAVSNGSVRQFILPGSDLDKLVRAAVPLKPDARADLLYNSEALENAHKTAAQTGDTAAPPPVSKPDLHFICFVKGKDGHLWELEGGWTGPLDRGVLNPEEDVLSEHALELGIRPFLKKQAEAEDADHRFSIIALAPSMD